MMSPIEKQGYLGDISTKSTAELMELLSRQEKILKKTKFVESLPDKGAKVRAFYEKLQQLISERTQIVDSSDVSKSPATRQIAQLHSTFAPASLLGDKQGHTLSESSVELQPNVTADAVKNNSSTEDDIRLQDNQVLAISSTTTITPSQGEDSSKVDMESAENENKTIVNSSDLEESLKKLQISGEVSVTERIQKEKTTHACSKALQNADEIHIPHKPNNFLKKSKVSDLPREYKFKSRDEDHVLPVCAVTRAVEESAATPPIYKHKESKLISLDESLYLQKTQKVKQEELQARNAAEKLSQRLGITMERYNPEGVDMSYPCFISIHGDV
ncbi:DNA-directed RNA polymerase II subunit GRINL1A-like [Ylistrum balloti]|uniref:DNA-directed RNA polymerase II subunit GRINL1A-like n=1 Tax=Ylistrum balloti TaxID=509963 RepID=UPI0029058823|nr:DNA-directed RNA polymerase II subunit GRINL1A-like [Ylistrum balloti]